MPARQPRVVVRTGFGKFHGFPGSGSKHLLDPPDEPLQEKMSLAIFSLSLRWELPQPNSHPKPKAGPNSKKNLPQPARPGSGTPKPAQLFRPLGDLLFLLVLWSRGYSDSFGRSRPAQKIIRPKLFLYTDRLDRLCFPAIQENIRKKSTVFQAGPEGFPPGLILKIFEATR